MSIDFISLQNGWDQKHYHFFNINKSPRFKKIAFINYLYSRSNNHTYFVLCFPGTPSFVFWQRNQLEPQSMYLCCWGLRFSGLRSVLPGTLLLVQTNSCTLKQTYDLSILIWMNFKWFWSKKLFDQTLIF